MGAMPPIVDGPEGPVTLFDGKSLQGSPASAAPYLVDLEKQAPEMMKRLTTGQWTLRDMGATKVARAPGVPVPW